MKITIDLLSFSFVPLRKYTSSTYRGHIIKEVNISVGGLVYLHTEGGIFASTELASKLLDFDYSFDSSPVLYSDNILCAIKDDRNLNISK